MTVDAFTIRRLPDERLMVRRIVLRRRGRLFQFVIDRTFVVATLDEARTLIDQRRYRRRAPDPDPVEADVVEHWSRCR
jgi:hypothetical protein